MWLGARLPSSDQLDKVAYQTISFAFPCGSSPLWPVRLGRGGLGTLLGLGSEGDVGVRHLGDLRRLPARTRDGWLAGASGGDHRHRRPCRRSCSATLASTSSSSACTPTVERNQVLVSPDPDSCFGYGPNPGIRAIAASVTLSHGATVKLLRQRILRCQLYPRWV